MQNGVHQAYKPVRPIIFFTLLAVFVFCQLKDVSIQIIKCTSTGQLRSDGNDNSTSLKDISVSKFELKLRKTLVVAQNVPEFKDDFA